MSNNLVQYIVIRGDLKWPIGAIVAQGCHASISAIVKYMASDSDTKQYLQHLQSMTKVVLKAQSEQQLVEVSEKLTNSDINYVLWTEQPENITTCLATVPRDRNILKPIFNGLKLFN